MDPGPQTRELGRGVFGPRRGSREPDRSGARAGENHSHNTETITGNQFLGERLQGNADEWCPRATPVWSASIGRHHGNESVASSCTELISEKNSQARKASGRASRCMPLGCGAEASANLLFGSSADHNATLGSDLGVEMENEHCLLAKPKMIMAIGRQSTRNRAICSELVRSKSVSPRDP